MGRFLRTGKRGAKIASQIIWQSWQPNRAVAWSPDRATRSAAGLGIVAWAGRSAAGLVVLRSFEREIACERLAEPLRLCTIFFKAPTRRPRGSSSAPTEAERGSPFAAAAGDARALTSLDSSRLESSHYPSRQWNPSKETAASPVAEGQLPIRISSGPPGTPL